jgi:hypothetical protein
LFRAEVIGSLLRPAYLQEARAAFEQGNLSVNEFKRLEDWAVDQVIALQEGTGVEVVSDGEMRRFLFMGPESTAVRSGTHRQECLKRRQSSDIGGNPLREPRGSATVKCLQIRDLRDDRAPGSHPGGRRFESG